MISFTTSILNQLLSRLAIYQYSFFLIALIFSELYCHTFLIDDGSRHRLYCLLLLSHADVNEADLREQAAKYGLEAEIDAVDN